MWGGRQFRRIQGTAWTSVVVAAVLLFAIAADIAADTRCHPLPRGEARAGLSAAPASPTEQDPCGAKCVPDCFCCSTLSVTALGLPVESAALAGRVASARERNCPTGVQRALYHPPIVLS